MKRWAVIFVALTTSAQVLMAQAPEDMFERAQSIIDDRTNPATTLTEEGVAEAVPSFQTDAPSETGLGNTDYEQGVLAKRVDGSVDGRAIRSLEDSAITRPRHEMGVNDAVLDNTHWANDNAEEIAGGLFTAEDGGECTTPALPTDPIFDQFCESQRVPQIETCFLDRQIWFDRFDTYQCDQKAAKFYRKCTEQISYECTTAPGCMAANIDISGPGLDVVWTGNSAALTFPNIVTPNFTGWIHNADFSIRVSDRAQPFIAVVASIHSRYAAQLLVNDDIRFSYSGNLPRPLEVLTIKSFLGTTIYERWGSGLLQFSAGNSVGVSVPLILTSYAKADPLAERWKQNTLILRHIANENGSDARLTLVFEGPCCNSIDETTEFVCEE